MKRVIEKTDDGSATLFVPELNEHYQDVYKRQVQPRTGKETVLTTLGQINKVLADNKAGKLPTPYSIRYPWADKPQMLLKVSGKYIVYDFENNRIVSTLKLKDKAANEDYCVANGTVAYTVNNNLYVNEQAITDEPEGIVCGQSVHRNEFGINKGTFWSPKGNLLAFYRMDESMVTQYPLVDITARVGAVSYTHLDVYKRQIFGKLNQTYDFIRSCRTFLHLERYLFRPRIFRCIQCIQGRQRQLTFQHIITSRFADLLAIKVIENIILNLKTDTNIFAQQTGKSDFLLTHLH